MNKKIFWLFLLLILALGLFLRWRNLAIVPLPGQSQDEYSNTWVGMSLLETGMPVGMTGVSGNLNRERIYVNPDHIFQQSASGDPLTIAYPWFDHPPLVGLVTGSFSYLRGARVFEDVTAGTIRKPALVFAGLTIFMIGLLGYEWFGAPVGLLAALFYAISPLTTVINRMVQAENFFVPLGLVSLYCWWKFAQEKRNKWWYLGILVLMAAVLMKLSAVAFVIAGMALLSKFVKQKWVFLLLGGAAAAAFSWWVFFGMALAPATFWSVLLSNSDRVYGIGYQAVSELVTTFKITGRVSLPDGWITASYIGFLAMLVGKVKNKEWVVYPALAYLAVYLFFGGESYGWYRIPFYPLTFIGLGWAVFELLRRAEVGSLFLFLIPLGVAAGKVIPVSGAWLTGYRLAPILIIGAGYFLRKQKLNRLFVAGMIALTVLVTIHYNLKIDSFFWQKLI